MLLALTQWLAEDAHIRAFNVFNYITLRAVLATLTALLRVLLALNLYAASTRPEGVCL